LSLAWCSVHKTWIRKGGLRLELSKAVTSRKVPTLTRTRPDPSSSKEENSSHLSRMSKHCIQEDSGKQCADEATRYQRGNHFAPLSWSGLRTRTRSPRRRPRSSLCCRRDLKRIRLGVRADGPSRAPDPETRLVGRANLSRLLRCLHRQL